jgi:Methyltransferase domain
VDDAEDPWLFRHKFDYIHMRLVFTCFQNPRNVIKSAFDFIENGGYLEFQDAIFPPYYAEPPEPGSPFVKWVTLIKDISAKAGRPWDNSKNYGRWMREIGFEEITEKKYYLAVGAWPENEKDKKLGGWQLENWLEAIKGSTPRFLSQIGWEEEEINVLIGQVRNELRAGKVKPMNEVTMVWGRKPLPSTRSANDHN